MNKENINPREQNENKPKERINLNDYYRKDDIDILKAHSADGRQDVKPNFEDQIEGSEDTIKSEPNQI